MQDKNLDIYGHEPIPWSRALRQLEAQAHEEGRGRTCWLATVDPDGSPHVAAVGALWVDGQFYFTSGPRTRKSRNLVANAKCSVSVSLDDIDVVIEGTARKVTDMPTLERVGLAALDVVRTASDLGPPRRLRMPVRGVDVNLVAAGCEEYLPGR